MRNTLAIFSRELAAYFATPLAYVFIVIFLVLAGVLTFFLGNFFERGQADLQAFFTFHPWLYLVLVPALSMRLWAEERKSGTIELFLTLPIRLREAVVAKFLAAWCFAGIALALTFPFWVTVNFLGDPDNGVILASYLASWLMAGAILALGAAVSAATKNQVIAFVVTAALAFVLIVAGTSTVLGLFRGWAPEAVIRAVAGASIFGHYSAVTRGVIAFADLFYFASLIGGNVLAARYLTGDIDLTADRLYTLSRGTRATLAKIDEPITLRFYYSARLGDTVPSYGVYAGRVRQMLDRYAAAAPGKLRLEVYDPQPFSAAEDQAVAFGLQGVPVNEQGETVYFGLAGTNSTDDRQIIPFFAAEREPFLEYDLTRLVHTLAFPKRTVVGLVSSLPLEGDMMAAMQGRPSEPMALLDQLRQTDRIEDLPLDFSAVPAEIDVLMVVHPRQLTPRTLFAIDQFVLKGGKALVFVDPYSELQAATASPGRSEEHTSELQSR